MNSRHLVAAIVVLSFPSVAGADGQHFTSATKFTVEVGGKAVGFIMSVDGLERPNGKTKRIDIVRLWNPTVLVPWPHADDGSLTPSPLSVVAENIGTDGAPIDTTFNFTNCLPTLQEFGWSFNAFGFPYVVEGDRIECQAVTIVPPNNTTAPR